MNLQQGGIIAGVLLMLFGGDVMSLFQSSATVRAQQAADEGHTLLRACTQSTPACHSYRLCAGPAAPTPGLVAGQHTLTCRGQQRWQNTRGILHFLIL